MPERRCVERGDGEYDRLADCADAGVPICGFDAPDRRGGLRTPLASPTTL